MKKLLCKMLCVLMLATFAIPADASAANLLASEPLTVEELEAGLLYDLKPLAAVYLDAGAMYGRKRCRRIRLGSLHCCTQ